MCYSYTSLLMSRRLVFPVVFPGPAWRSLLSNTRRRNALAPIVVLFNGTFPATAGRLTAAARSHGKATSIGDVDTIRTPLFWGVTTVFSNLYWYSSSVHLGQQKESTIHTYIGIARSGIIPLKTGWRHRSWIWEFSHLWRPVQIVSTLWKCVDSSLVT